MQNATKYGNTTQDYVMHTLLVSAGSPLTVTLGVLPEGTGERPSGYLESSLPDSMFLGWGN